MAQGGRIDEAHLEQLLDLLAWPGRFEMKVGTDRFRPARGDLEMVLEPTRILVGADRFEGTDLRELQDLEPARGLLVAGDRSIVVRSRAVPGYLARRWPALPAAPPPFQRRRIPLLATSAGLGAVYLLAIIVASKPSDTSWTSYLAGVTYGLPTDPDLRRPPDRTRDRGDLGLVVTGPPPLPRPPPSPGRARRPHRVRAGSDPSIARPRCRCWANLVAATTGPSTYRRANLLDPINGVP